MRSSLEASMVKTTRTSMLRAAFVSPAEFTSHDDPIAKSSGRREEGLHRAAGERGGCGQAREMTAPRRCGANGRSTVGEHIGRELRELYDDVLAQPVPDRFLSLLNKLDASAISAVQAADRRGDMD